MIIPEPYDNIGFYLILAGIVIGIIASIYDCYTKQDLVKEYKPEFAKYSIEVVEVSFISDFYTASDAHDENGNAITRRDRSKYIVFSKPGSLEEVEGEGQIDVLPIGPRFV